MKKLFNLIFWGGLLVLTHPLWLPPVGKFLLVPDDPVKSDAIVVLRGEEYFRFQKGAELYKQGLSPFILVSVIPTMTQPYDLDRKVFGYEKLNEVDITYKFFAYFGVPPEGIRFTGEETTSTYEEALAAKKWMLEKGYHSMILVTSTYHMRRVLLLFTHVFKGTGIEIHTATGKNLLMDPEHWWTRERDVRRVAEEYCCLLANGIYHILLKKNKTSFDTV